MVLALAVAFASSAAAYAVHKGTTYRATTEVVLTNIQPPSVNGSTAAGSPTATTEALFLAGQAAFARSSLVLDQAARRAQGVAPGITPKTLAAMSTVTPSATADILEMSVTAQKADSASRLVAIYATAYTAAHKRLLEDQYGSLAAGLEEAIASLDKKIDSTSRTGKPQRALTRELLLDVQNRAALTNFVNRAVKGTIVLPTTASPAAVQQSPLKYGIAGALVGLVLGLIGAFLLEALDTRLRTSRQVARALEMPLLASVPTPPQQFRRAGQLVTMAPGEPQAEPYRMLAARVDQICRLPRIRTILVTSALEGEGKSTTAANLAVALTQIGRTVVLLDGDLLRSTAPGFFGLDAHRGIADVIEGGTSLAEATVPVDVPATSGPSHPLGVVAAGAPVGDPSTLLASAAFADMLRAQRESAEYVVIDSPPLLSTSAGLLIGAHADGILVVARSGRLNAAAALHLKDALGAISAPTLGFVLTAADQVGEYGYGSGSYSPGTRSVDLPDAPGGVATGDPTRVSRTLSDTR